MPSAISPPLKPVHDDQILLNPPDLSGKLPRLTPRRRTKQEPSKSTPPPAAKPLPLPPTEPTFHHPTRRILSSKDHELFLSSSTYDLIVSFLFAITDSIRNTSISDITSKPRDSAVCSILRILDRTSEALSESPADHNGGSRFGNPAFRTFLTKLDHGIADWHEDEFPKLPPGAQDELNTYFLSSFGSSLRIDYGSGHELNFLIYLLCLNRLSLLPPPTFPELALVVFPRYLHLMRRVQETYYLEPAGSHGVWGLDDYHFLPFLFGASQLADHPFIRPLAIHSTATIDAYGDDFLYLDMVRHVNATKTVQGLRWHSPMLDDISGVKEGWGKICDGMKKMFVREVIGKLVVMQHFLFGGLVPAVQGMSEDEDVQAARDGDDGELLRAEGHAGHAHNADAWGDCCGIKVPSSVGAVREMKKRTGGEGLRRLPFD